MDLILKKSVGTYEEGHKFALQANDFHLDEHYRIGSGVDILLRDALGTKIKISCDSFDQLKEFFDFDYLSHLKSKNQFCLSEPFGIYESGDVFTKISGCDLLSESYNVSEGNKHYFLDPSNTQIELICSFSDFSKMFHSAYSEETIGYDIGERGPQGPPGKAGARGDRGDIGPRGRPGKDGKDGKNGSVGPQGIQGDIGPQGEPGEIGPQGIQGIQGIPGVDGAPGIKGDPGLDGAIGPAGADGKDGAAGERGLAGKDGKDGLDGKDGVDGKDGLDGKDGVDGKDGRDGKVGAAGKDGLDGKVGTKGPKGEKGSDGKAGKDGKPGKDGAKGETGLQGPDGAVGPQGESGLLKAVYPLRYDAAAKSIDLDIRKLAAMFPSGGGMDTAYNKVVADGITLSSIQYVGETLTLVGGSNVTLSADASTNTVTINSSGGGGGGSSTSNSLLVTQASHGLITGDAVYFDGTIWRKASASSVDTLSIGLVEYLTINTFNVIFSGQIGGLAGLSAGHYYYLSDTISGGLTFTEPTISNPVLFSTGTTSGVVMPWRPLDNTYAVENQAGSSLTISQASHGLVDGDAIYFNGTLWVKAIANTTTTIGLALAKVINVNTFTAIFSGSISLPGLSAGQFYFVSPTIPGSLTTQDSTISNPILFATSATHGMIVPWRAVDTYDYDVTGIRTITGNTNVLSSDRNIICDASLTSINATLPRPDINIGKEFSFKKIDSGAFAVTVLPYTAETIDNASSKSTTTQYTTISVVSDGTNWWVR